MTPLDLCKCFIQEAKIITTKTIPVQVDGEAVRLNPCTIVLSHLNKARILAKKKTGRKLCHYDSDDGEKTMNVRAVSMRNYRDCDGDKERILRKCINIGEVRVDRASDLRHTRNNINKLVEDINNGNGETSLKLSKDWAFVDFITTTNYFRIDLATENNYFVVDISEKDLIIVDGWLGSNDNDDLKNTIDDVSSDTETILEDNNPTFHIPIPVYEQAGGLLEKNTEAVLRAARLGDLQMMNDLHKDGYSLMAIDETAKTALHYGARFGNKDVVKFLLKNASHSIIDIVDNEKGQTALHKAAAYERSDICSLLVTAGASLLVRDREGRTARMLAADAGADPGLLSYLENQAPADNQITEQKPEK